MGTPSLLRTVWLAAVLAGSAVAAVAAPAGLWSGSGPTGFAGKAWEGAVRAAARPSARAPGEPSPWVGRAWEESAHLAYGAPPSPAAAPGESSSMPPPTAAPPAESASVQDFTDHSMSVKKVFLNLPGDQRDIWTSPARFHPHDLTWLLPLGVGTGGLLYSDRHSMLREQSNAQAISRSNTVANAGLGAMLAVPAFLYVVGSYQGRPRWRETGLLSAEAVINSLGVNEALKAALGRQRPTATDGLGDFFQGASNASFPSGHSMLAWTVASVIAHEYPGPLTQALVYGGAAAVSIARVTGRQHFPADVVVGSFAGWLIGRQVYRAHHDPDLDDMNFGTFVNDHPVDAEKLGSPFVPLDSWVYPALKRLAALGYIRTQFLGLRPWTRRECRRQTEEAAENAVDLPADSSVQKTIRELRAEFSRDGQYYESAQLDSIYTRYGHISGTPLRDSYHFGQSLWNDYGRPFDQGDNAIVGASGSAVAGPFFFYASGEYQHAPGRGPLTLAQRTLIASLDSNPVQPPIPIPATDRFWPVEMYAGIQLGSYAVSFGKENLWLGPGESAPFMLSDNPDGMYMLRLTRIRPLVLPWIFKYLGEIKSEFLFGKLSGHQFPARPFFNLQKISVHPTPNLEIGFTRASVMAGVGHPFTAHNLVRNFFTVGDTNGPFGDPNDPGDRKSGFDFSYRVPKLRNWLTVYADLYSDDDPSPLANPRRAAVDPGLYLSHFPGLPDLDLRLEVVSTRSLTSIDRGGQFYFFNTQYHDDNLNNGFLLGSPVGRDARAYQAWSTYHFSGQTNLEFSFRQLKIGPQFLPGGGTQSDASVRLLWQPHPQWSVDAFVQYERYLIPAVQASAQTDVTGSVKLTFTPHWQIHSGQSK